MYKYDEDEDKVYVLINGAAHLIIDCGTEEENLSLSAYAKAELEHLKLYSLDEYVEMVRNRTLKEFLYSFNRYEHELEDTIAHQTAEKDGHAVTPMDEYMARLTAIEMMNS